MHSHFETFIVQRSIALQGHRLSTPWSNTDGCVPCWKFYFRSRSDNGITRSRSRISRSLFLWFFWAIKRPLSSTSYNRFPFHFILSNKRTIWGQSLTQLANYCVICSIFLHTKAIINLRSISQFQQCLLEQNRTITLPFRAKNWNVAFFDGHPVYIIRYDDIAHLAGEIIWA